MLTFGFTSRLPAGLSLFLWEADRADLYTVLEDANFLSQVFSLDVYVSQSSPQNFHELSFDVLTTEEARSVQLSSVFDGDFLPLKEVEMYGHKGNTLRLGTKGTKPRPQFVKVFYARKNPHMVAIGHFRVYKRLCGVPELPRAKRKRLAKFPIEWAIYETGIGTRKVRTDSPFDRF